MDMNIKPQKTWRLISGKSAIYELTLTGKMLSFLGIDPSYYRNRMLNLNLSTKLQGFVPMVRENQNIQILENTNGPEIAGRLAKGSASSTHRK